MNTLNEFEIIKRFFQKPGLSLGVKLGIGDDCALTEVPPGYELVITVDTLVENRHFFADCDAFSLGYKALATSLSDLAAMGATPRWTTLSLTLTKVSEAWLTDFSRGFFSLAHEFDVALIGGNLTHGPLTINVTALGVLPANTAITRAHAQVNDKIYVTNTLGDAGLALRNLQHQISPEPTLLVSLLQPYPRVREGMSLRKLANAGIDISDGLSSDLRHILEQSQVGAMVYVDQLPLSTALRALPLDEAYTLALTAGDDYELCFTVPEDKIAQLKVISQSWSIPITCIGHITKNIGLDLRFTNGQPYNGTCQGYQHF